MDKSFLKNALIAIFLCIIVSLFLFPIGFRGLPESLNSKQILAVIGVIFYLYECATSHSILLSRTILSSAILASVFSIWNYFATVANNTSDYSYATYVISFFVWMFSAYTVATIFGKFDSLNLSCITKQLSIVCIIQCLSAILIDNMAGFQALVDTWIIQDETPKEVDRLYGIGASLDNAGVRFSCVLLLIAHQIREAAKAERTSKTLLLQFLLIGILGNMISRTTTVGLLLGAVFIVVDKIAINPQNSISIRDIRAFLAAALVLLLIVITSIYFYNNNAFAHSQIRFAFEGFFNYFEKGELSTGSTDKLMHMWVWPTDTKGWLYGYGLFDGWAFHTDIGYCRFTMYSGLIGLILFSVFFIYNGFALRTDCNFPLFLALCFIAISFIIWVKVSTDIFQIYALLLCFGELERKKAEIDY